MYPIEILESAWFSQNRQETIRELSNGTLKKIK
jgi:hypothetical protein